jgi:glycosyltransferase involved in cell wall biosynthesis
MRPTSDAGRQLPRMLVIVPCFNEAQSVASVVHAITELQETYDILVIDDGSTDDTHRIASALVPCVTLPHNLGIGGAVQTGIIYASRNDYDFCVQIDGDGQHPPDQIPLLLEAYHTEPANLIVGSRYLSTGTFHSTWTRRFGSLVISVTLQLLFGGQRYSDPTSGMRLMDRSAIAYFQREYPADFPEPISIAKAIRKHLTVREVPVQMKPRFTGDSSISGLKTLNYMFRVLSHIWLEWLQRNH